MSQKVLIIDDDPAGQRLMEYTLRREGYDVVLASDGPQGLEKARAERPDLVILDIMMPGMDGYEVSRQLRSTPATADLPVLMLTAKTQLTDKVSGFRAGADDYVTKPVEPAEVVARVKALLARARRITAPSTQARTVALLGAKGGVGTTTAAVNLSISIAQRSQPLILADMRPYMGTVAYQLGLTRRATLADLLLLDVEAIDQQALNGVLVSHPAGFRVLMSAPEPGRHPVVPPGHAQAIVNGLRSMTNFLLLDLPPGLPEANAAILPACDLIAIITEPEPLSLACARDVIRLLEKQNISNEIVGILICNRSRSTSLIAPAEVASFLNRRLLGTIPPAPEACSEANRQGMPVVLLPAAEIVAMVFRELADRLLADRVPLQSFGVSASAPAPAR